jgi:hypothetical protein
MFDGPSRKGCQIPVVVAKCRPPVRQQKRVQHRGKPETKRAGAESESTCLSRETYGTLPGCGRTALLSGGLRFATTTGYYLPALQAEMAECIASRCHLRFTIHHLPYRL